MITFSKMGSSQSSRQQNVTNWMVLVGKQAEESLRLNAIKIQEERDAAVAAKAQQDAALAKAQQVQVVYCCEREPYPGYNALLAERILAANEDMTSTI